VSQATRARANVAPGVHALGSRIVNWYLVEEDGQLTAVDSGLPRFAETLEADLRALGHEVGDVEAVVLTHSDGDHMGMARALQEAGARVLIHADDDESLRKPGPKSGDASPMHLLPLLVRPAFWRFMGPMARAGGGKPPKVEGAETFRDGQVLDVPGRPRALHTPGHTNGHSALLFAARGVLFVGDELCTWNPLTGEREPQVMPKPFNVDFERCFESLGALERLDAEVLLPGHGEPWREGAAAAVARAREARER
jgi:glyoxylase-like metal-dependent hydrolase (beta-lactamase superfamily II)